MMYKLFPSASPAKNLFYKITFKCDKTHGMRCLWVHFDSIKNKFKNVCPSIETS